MSLLHSVEALSDFSIAATDGDLGRVRDVYFDDREWTIRHLVVDTGGWLGGRKVLIAPHAVKTVDWDGKKLFVGLTREQVRNSPDIDTEVPVSRQHEKVLSDYYGHPYYWSGPYLWGYAIFPGILEGGMRDPHPPEETERHVLQRKERERSNADPHLRGGKEVVGYRLRATDDTFGHIEDLLFDQESWKIELLAVDTRHWWHGKKVLVSPGCIARIDWDGKDVAVDITREQVERSPEYDPRHPPSAGVAHGVFRHAG